MNSRETPPPAAFVSRPKLASGGEPIFDFVSCSYLGFDIDPWLHERGSELIRSWGSLAGWSRAKLDPVIYRDLEVKIAKFLGAHDAHLCPSVTLANFSLVPALVGQGGLVIADEEIYPTLFEACRLARDHGARVESLRHQNMNRLEDILRRRPIDETKVVVVNGVYPWSAAPAPIAALQYLCHRYGAWLYVEDTHGFGVLGERPTKDNPYGLGGNGVVRHFNSDLRRTFYVSSFAKAFGAEAAFAILPEEFPAAAHLRFASGAVSPYVVGQAHAALDLNESIGETARERLRAAAVRFKEGLTQLGLTFTNDRLLPQFTIDTGGFDLFTRAAEMLEREGIAASFRAFPHQPERGCSLLFSLTASHDDAEITRALAALAKVRDRLRPSRGS